MVSDLQTKVLKDVSRSFYLSLRFLPEGFRGPTSVGYLLARASDTIADAGELPGEERVEMLENYRSFVRGEGEFSVAEIAGVSEGEAILMARLDECVAALRALPSWQQDSVIKVVEIITEGQRWDLLRFRGEGVVQLTEDEELRDYTYQVAGCVGEFWTEIGCGVDQDFARASREEMMAWGQAYGRSLQLINILRDVPEDLEIGRCYLPGKMTEEGLLCAREKWIAEARAGLAEADRYADALNGKRMRFGTVLPAMIGRETLNRLEEASWDEWRAGVKVPRKMVYGMMRKAVWFGLFG